jgi:hypothetical protein
LSGGSKEASKKGLPKVHHEMVGYSRERRRTPLQEIEVHRSLQTPFPDHGVFLLTSFGFPPFSSQPQAMLSRMWVL